jgi:protein arginine kinase
VSGSSKRFDASSGGAQWLRTDGRDCDVVMSSRIRYARNIAGFPFPNRARKEERRELLGLVRERALNANVADKLLWIDLEESPTLERLMLHERHLISKQHAKGAEPRAVIVSAPDEWLSIMVNEEDHLRIQVIRGGLALDDALDVIDSVDDKLEASLDFAFSSRFGYLTACPTNVGTGLRVSTMLHLPALKLSGEIEKVKRAAKALNVAVRGFYGEGSEAVGDFFQLSNQTTLGKTERELLEELSQRVIPEIVRYERQARGVLMEKKALFLQDRVHRALGTLLHARTIDADEALSQLSLVRLGSQLGVLKGLDQTVVNQLVLLTQPAHVQRVVGRELDQNERRRERATIIRERLGA